MKKFKKWTYWKTEELPCRCGPQEHPNSSHPRCPPLTPPRTRRIWDFAFLCGEHPRHPLENISCLSLCVPCACIFKLLSKHSSNCLVPIFLSNIDFLASKLDLHFGGPIFLASSLSWNRSYVNLLALQEPAQFYFAALLRVSICLHALTRYSNDSTSDSDQGRVWSPGFRRGYSTDFFAYFAPWAETVLVLSRGDRRQLLCCLEDGQGTFVAPRFQTEEIGPEEVCSITFRSMQSVNDLGIVS